MTAAAVQSPPSTGAAGFFRFHCQGPVFPALPSGSDESAPGLARGGGEEWTEVGGRT